MKLRLSLVTLGVADIARARAFYEALAAGGSAVKSPEKVFWGGYSGYVRDLDGHLWEVAHNPFFPLDAKGVTHLPETAA